MKMRNINRIIFRIIKGVFNFCKRILVWFALYEVRSRYPDTTFLDYNIQVSADCRLGKFTKLFWHVTLNNVMLGEHAVILPDVSLTNVTLLDFSYTCSSIHNADIGKFCSIGPFCRIGQGIHPSSKFVSTYPSFYSKNNSSTNVSFVDHDKFEEFKKITIGNDVWIGSNCIIMDGVKIGDGAIIGAGAVVTKNIEDYAIVGGVPAKLIRYRFTKEQITVLKNVAWWNRDIDWIKEHSEDFEDIEKFCEKFW